MKLVIVGSVAIDDVETPSGRREESIGGSALHASVAASKFTEVGVVGVVGDDFPESVCDKLKGIKIDLKGLERVSGKTFRWKGIYTDLNRAETIDTQLNVFADFSPKLPEKYKSMEILFLGNIHPQLQLDVINQANSPKFVACDTMNYWIQSTPELLKEVIKKVHILFINEEEIKSLTGKHNIFDAADEVLALGTEYVVIKRGEYGAVAYNNSMMFFAPVYPVRTVFDPTGAGDSFAGGFLGYLAKVGNHSHDSIKNAMLHGAVVASYNIASFSFDNMMKTSLSEIDIRVNYLRDAMYVK